jgi:hypothetical protein
MNELLAMRKWLAIGSGVGLEIGDEDLRVTMVRVRPSGTRVLGAATIARFRERPAAEWGAIYHDFLKRLGGSHMSATVVLPRRDLIVRPLALAGVPDRDLASAIQLQIDSLHPYGEDEAAWSWARVGDKGSVLIAIVHRATLERYISLFAEAGVKVAGFTASAAALHGAVRLLAQPPAAFLGLADGPGGLEAYGESETRAAFSATFDMPRERAAALAAAELRLPAESGARELADLLPRPRSAPPEYDLGQDTLAYAAALAAACPLLSLPVNLLPPKHRTSSSRAMFIPSAALAALLAACVAALASIHPIEDRKYLGALEREIHKLEPLERRANALDRSIDRTRARARLLDAFRSRTKVDLDALLEIDKLLPPPAFLTSLEMNEAALVLNGRAEQAAPLLKTLDGSPRFQGSEFTVPIARAGNTDVFRIHSSRRGTAR